MDLSNAETNVVEVTNAKLKIFFNVLDNIRRQKIVDEKEKFDMEIDLFSRFFNIVFRLPSSLQISQVWSQKDNESVPFENLTQNDSSSPTDLDTESLPDEVLEAEGANCNEEEVIDDFDDIIETLADIKAGDEKVETTKDPEILTVAKGTVAEMEPQSSVNYNLTDVNCKVCGFSAGRSHSLKLHIEMVHLVFYYYCNFCRYQHKDKYELRKHIRQTHKESKTALYQTPMRFHCNACEYTDSFSLFRQHMLKDHPELNCFYSKGNTEKADEKDKICNFCGKNVARVVPMNSHIESNHMKTKYQCKSCNFQTLQRAEIRDHVLSLHFKIDLKERGSRKVGREKIPIEIKEQLPEQITRTCTVCDQKLHFMENLTNHIKDNHPNEYIRRPYRRQVRKKILNSDKKQRFSCNECKYSNNLRSHIKRHIMNKHMKARFKCQKCDFENSIMVKIIRHDKDHHDSKFVFSSTCNACEKQFDDLLEFKQHIEAVHCAHFEKRSRKNKRIDAEEHQNPEEKENSKLSSNSNPITKKKNSRKEKVSGQFACRDCPYSSDIATNIKLHISKIHHSPKFNCKNCGYECKNVKDIFEHIKSDHDDDQSLIGSLCGGYCDTYFEDYQQFKDHGRVHFEYLYSKRKRRRKTKVKAGTKVDGQLMHKCSKDDCDFVSSKACVRIHIMLRHMRTKFTCILCMISFKNVNLASRHAKRAHNKDLTCLKSYCEACDFSSDDFIAFDREHTMSVHCYHLKPEGRMGGRRWNGFRDNKPAGQ